MTALFSGWHDVRVSQTCLALCNPVDHSPWNSPGQKTGANYSEGDQISGC